MVRLHEVSPEAFGAELRELLREYASQNGERLDELTLAAIKQLKQLSRQTAPRGTRDAKLKSGEVRPRFHTSIVYKKLHSSWFGASRYLWYVKKPNSRLTHLIAKSHRTKNHRIVPGNPFLQNALDAVLRDYEENIRRYIAE